MWKKSSGPKGKVPIRRKRLYFHVSFYLWEHSGFGSYFMAWNQRWMWLPKLTEANNVAEDRTTRYRQESQTPRKTELTRRSWTVNVFIAAHSVSIHCRRSSEVAQTLYKTEHRRHWETGIGGQVSIWQGPLTTLHKRAILTMLGALPSCCPVHLISPIAVSWLISIQEAWNNG